MKRACVVALLLVGVPLPSLAAGPLGRRGDPIRTSDYAVDLTQGPVLAGARVTGLAGAYVAIAEGIDGNLQTPVAPAVRPAYSTTYFDYDLGLGLTLPATLGQTDFFNTGVAATDTGHAEQEGFVFVNPALNLQWEHFGIGLTFEFQNYSLRREDRENLGVRRDDLTAGFAVGHLQVAQGFLDGQLFLGAGWRLVGLEVERSNQDVSQTLFSTSGSGIEGGVLWRPHGRRFRLGAAFRGAVTTVPDLGSAVTPQSNGDRIIPGEPGVDLNDPRFADPVQLQTVLDDPDTLWLPDRVTLPWDLNVGFAVQIGPRPFNPKWLDPREPLRRLRTELGRRAQAREAFRRTALATAREHGRDIQALRAALDADLERQTALDELRRLRVESQTAAHLQQRYRDMSRFYLLVSASVVMTGTADQSVGVESFLQRVVDRSGEDLVFSPRLGVELEPVPHWVKVRAGTYGEPSRFEGATARLHGTVGFDQKLFSWPVFGLFDEHAAWRVSTALDAAPRYLGWGISIGMWH